MQLFLGHCPSPRLYLLVKSQGGHKYTRREGSKGSYRYFYGDDDKIGSVSDTHPDRLHEEAHPHGKYHVEDHGAGVHAVYHVKKRARKPRIIANASSMEGAQRHIARHVAEAKDEMAGGTNRSSKLAKIVKEHQAREIDGRLVDVQTANVVLKVAEALNEKNRKKFMTLPFGKMVEVAWSLTKSRSLVLDLVKASGEGSRGGKIVGHTQSGKPVYETGTREHPTKGWGQALDAKTDKGHEHKAPKVVDHGGKTYVKASHNSDSGAVHYHEHQADRHVLDKKKGFASTASFEHHPHAPGGVVRVQGQPKKAGGDLPNTINDPHHGNLSVRSHNSDSGHTLYHKTEHNSGWSNPTAKSWASKPTTDYELILNTLADQMPGEELKKDE